MSGIAKIGSLAIRVCARPFTLPEDPGHDKEDQTTESTADHRELLFFSFTPSVYLGVLCGFPNQISKISKSLLGFGSLPREDTREPISVVGCCFLLLLEVYPGLDTLDGAEVRKLLKCPIQ